MTNDLDWVNTFSINPPDGLVVETKIDDKFGPRNVQKLKLVGKLWFVPDGSTYVYYVPTHWRRTP